MGWINRLPKRGRPHECIKPKAQHVQPGSTWRCDSCGKGWKVLASDSLVVEAGFWGQRQEPYHYWEEASMKDLYPLPPSKKPASSSDAN